MSFNVDGLNACLSAYIDQTKSELIGKAVLSAKTAKILNLMTGVKGATALNLITTNVTFADGKTCGWTDGSSSVLTQRNIVPGQIKVQASWCDKELSVYWANQEVKMRAGMAQLPAEQALIDNLISKIAETLETAIWQGDTTSDVANLNQFDGLVKIIDAATAVTKHATNTGITTITESNVITVVDNVFRVLPDALLDKEDVVIVCGADTFRKYVVALRSANLYHYTYDIENGLELVIPGTNVKLMALNGLNGTNRLFGFQLANVYYGTDLMGDEEAFNFRYDDGDEIFKLTVSFTAGVQVAFPDQVAEFTLAK